MVRFLTGRTAVAAKNGSRLLSNSTLPADVHATLQQSLQAALSLLDWPAAIVADGEEIMAHNALWTSALRPAADPGKAGALADALRAFAPTDPLIAALRSKTRSIGMITVHQHSAGRIGAPERREVTVRWRQIDPQPFGRTMAMVILQDADAVERPAVVIAAQQSRINRLLVRQTLIEEAERRRLGRALHDVVAQDLAQLRRSISDQQVQIGDVEPILARLDRVIDEVRTLSFELSPPILEDLGLCPALQWLADHISTRYGTDVRVTPDATEPSLASSTRTIVFRAVRELLINAAKHSPGAEVTVSCGTVGNVARVVVRDTGPGFDTSLAHTFSDGVHHFGLMSVDQQIRGIGGTFDLVSSIGSGTTIWITVPLEPEEEDAHV